MYTSNWKITNNEAHIIVTSLYTWTMCFCIHKDPEKYLNFVDRYFCIKDPPECPTMYLGEDISKFVIPIYGNGVVIILA